MIQTIKTKAGLIINLIGALLFTYAFSNHFFENDYSGINSIIHILCFVIAFYVLKKAGEIHEYKTVSLVFGIIYSIVYVFGRKQYWTLSIIYFYYPLSNLLSNILYIVGFSLFFTAVFRIAADKILNFGSNAKNFSLHIYKKKYFVAVWLIMAASWLPCFLTFYPGVFAYDLPEQTEQAVQNLITRHHPPLHTLLWKFFLELEKITPLRALPTFSVFQIILVSFSLTSLLFYLIKRQAPKIVIILSLLFFIFNPVMAIISILSTKDIVFAVFFIFTIIYMDKIFFYGEKSIQNCVKLGIFVLFSCLFRNNGVYALILTMIVLFICAKGSRKIVLGSFLAPIALYFVINGPVYTLLGFQGGTPKEKMCIPMQQMASVVALKEEELTEDEKEQLSKYFYYDLLKEWYNPRFADPVKRIVNDEYFNEHQYEFLKLWFQLLKKNPICYVDAFLNHNIPYWYQEANTSDRYSKREYLEVDIMERPLYPLERESKLPRLANFYYRVAGFYSIEDKPLIVNLNSMATPIWVIFFSVFMLLCRKKNSKRILIILPMLFLWMTYIIGPVCCFRYVIPIYVLYPYFLFLMLKNTESCEEQEAVSQNLA